MNALGWIILAIVGLWVFEKLFIRSSSPRAWYRHQRFRWEAHRTGDVRGAFEKWIGRLDEREED